MKDKTARQIAQKQLHNPTKWDTPSHTEEVLKEASHEELCDDMLEHYDQISKEVCHWNSGVPEAIKFYKEYGGKKLQTTLQNRDKELVKFTTENSFDDPTYGTVVKLDRLLSFLQGNTE